MALIDIFEVREEVELVLSRYVQPGNDRYYDRALRDLSFCCNALQRLFESIWKYVSQTEALSLCYCAEQTNDSVPRMQIIETDVDKEYQRTRSKVSDVLKNKHKVHWRNAIYIVIDI